MSKPNYGVVLCWPIGTVYEPVRGSRVYYCSVCRTEIWASPASQQLINAGLPIVCVLCAPKAIGEAIEQGEEIIPRDVRGASAEGIKPWPFKGEG